MTDLSVMINLIRQQLEETRKPSDCPDRELARNWKYGELKTLDRIANKIIDLAIATPDWDAAMELDNQIWSDMRIVLGMAKEEANVHM